jgi:hypothetical protein
VIVDAVLGADRLTGASVTLHYDGCRPPAELLAAVARRGWSVPPPPPPPAWAVEWARPDPSADHRATVRPWPAEHALALPRPPACPRAAWSGLLATLWNHGARIRGDVPEQATAALAVVACTVPTGHGARLQEILVAAGGRWVATHDLVVERRRYRAATNEHEVAVVRAEAIVDGPTAEVLRVRLRGHGFALQSRPAGPVDVVRLSALATGAASSTGPAGSTGSTVVEALGARGTVMAGDPVPPPGRPLGSGGSGGSVPAPAVPPRRVRVDIGPGRPPEPAAFRTVPPLDRLPVAVTAVHRPVRTRYRGTEMEFGQRSWEVQVRCADTDVAAVVAALAALGVPAAAVVVD